MYLVLLYYVPGVFKVKVPELLSPPWEFLLEKATEYEWSAEAGYCSVDNDGTTHLKGWYFFFTAPYSPEWWPIESFWAYGEHFVALAKNCYVAGVTRTVAQAMIRDR